MPLVQNPSIGAGAAPMLVATQVISAAQLIAFAGGAISVVPAPGAGNLIVPITNMIVYNFGTVDYPGQPALDIRYHGTATSLLVAAPGVLTGQGTSELVNSPGDIAVGALVVPATILNTSADLILTSGSFATGPILTATLGAGGAGYAANDTGTITNGANDATYKVLTVGGGGAVLTFQITNPGTVCSVSNGNATVDGGAQPGVGVGFTVNITSVTRGDGTLKVTTYYQILAVP